MPKTTITVGVLLSLIGIIAYATSGAASITALIPAFIGIPILICGLIARNPGPRKIAIHVALVIALIGALGSLMNVVKLPDLIAGTAQRPTAIIVSLFLFVICLAYVVIGVRSFINARRTPSN